MHDQLGYLQPANRLPFGSSLPMHIGLFANAAHNQNSIAGYTNFSEGPSSQKAAYSKFQAQQKGKQFGGGGSGKQGGGKGVNKSSERKQEPLSQLSQNTMGAASSSTQATQGPSQELTQDALLSQAQPLFSQEIAAPMGRTLGALGTHGPLGARVAPGTGLHDGGAGLPAGPLSQSQDLFPLSQV